MSALKKAVYVSERLSASGGSCLRFWYAIPNYKQGSSLQVLSSADFITANVEKLFRESTNDEWTEGLVSIIPPITSDSPFVNYWVGSFFYNKYGHRTGSSKKISQIIKFLNSK